MTDIHPDFPKIISVELQTKKLVVPFGKKIAPELVRQLLDTSLRGVVTKEGKWQIKPNETCLLTKSDIGLYKVFHNLGYGNCSLNVSLLEQPGSFSILEHGPVLFSIQTTIDGKPEDLGFSFSLARVISQQA